MFDVLVINGDGNAIRPSCAAAQCYADLVDEHTQTVDLLEMQDELIADLREQRLTLAALAYTLSQQVIHAGQRPDCDAAALALCDAVLGESTDSDERERCGSSCHADEGE